MHYGICNKEPTCHVDEDYEAIGDDDNKLHLPRNKRIINEN
jgi:hypothetical protein